MFAISWDYQSQRTNAHMCSAYNQVYWPEVAPIGGARWGWESLGYLLGIPQSFPWLPWSGSEGHSPMRLHDAIHLVECVQYILQFLFLGELPYLEAKNPKKAEQFHLGSWWVFGLSKVIVSTAIDKKPFLSSGLDCQLRSITKEPPIFSVTTDIWLNSVVLKSSGEDFVCRK